MIYAITAWLLFNAWLLIGLLVAFRTFEKNDKLTAHQLWRVILVSWPLVLVRGMK